MIKRFTLIVAVFMMVCASWAEKVPANKAEQVAKNVYYEFSGIGQNQLSMGEPYAVVKGEHPVYYVFNIENHKGFVIVSADDRVLPVLGYSLTGRYSNENQPPQFIDWMDGYAKQIEYVIEHNIESTPEIDSKWSQYAQTSANFDFDKNTKDVSPLLDPIAWNQDNGWNMYCPADPAGPGGHAYAGCVATAASMVMKYYEHPLHGVGSSSYYCAPYGTLSVNYSEATYEWDAMSNTSATSAAALLMYHVGVSVQMGYGPDGSGAYTSMLETSLRDYFSYLPSIDFQLKDDHPSDWEDILMNELDNSRPMVYKGHGPDGGHAFCCDGYSSNGYYFHFNWGWSGWYNGNFTLTNLNPGGSTFNDDQGALIGIEPDLTVITTDPPTNLEATVVEDDVTLTWTSPIAPVQGFEDGFETYNDFALSFGDYTQIDGDGGETWGSNSFDYSNEGYIGSFIIFNPSQCSPANPDGWEPHSGDKFAACFDAVTASAPNDDWLITPQLSIASGDQLAFWAKSVTDQYGLERFQVGVSTTGTSAGDFTIISSGAYVEAPVDWTEFTYDLSSYDGQDIYVGIHVVSNDAFCFFLDDLFVGSGKETKFANNFENIETSTKVVERAKHSGNVVVADFSKNTKSLVGFQVYRNGSELGSQLGADVTEYTDAALENGEYTYYVTAVYEAGESDPSNEVSAYVNIGINELENQVRIYPNPADNVLNIDFESNTACHLIFRDVTGRIVKKFETHGTQIQINLSDLNEGVYFMEVITENERFTERVIVK